MVVVLSELYHRTTSRKTISRGTIKNGMQLNRQAAEERLNTQGQSFLAKQRQVRTTNRTQSIPNSNSQRKAKNWGEKGRGLKTPKVGVGDLIAG
uniref:Uncharacterized protein n=1 Tax=Magallana gigas TaxID=29159 RepID=K1R5J9_MAGGI